MHGNVTMWLARCKGCQGKGDCCGSEEGKTLWGVCVEAAKDSIQHPHKRIAMRLHAKIIISHHICSSSHMPMHICFCPYACF